MGKHLIAPSALSADFGNLQRDIEMINASDADWLHVDVMDGMFVPNISFGPDIVRVMHTHCRLPLDVHLMIEQPDRYIDVFAAAGAATLSVHAEACTHLHRTVQQIRAAGMQPGVAINPHTPVHVVEDVLEDLALVVVMSVNPGFGGQKFIYRTLHKVQALRDMIDSRNLSVHIEVDGGIGLQNAEAILQAGANVLVAGNSVFKAENPHLAIYSLKNLGIQGLYA